VPRMESRKRYVINSALNSTDASISGSTEIHENGKRSCKKAAVICVIALSLTSINAESCGLVGVGLKQYVPYHNVKSDANYVQTHSSSSPYITIPIIEIPTHRSFASVVTPNAS